MHLLMSLTQPQHNLGRYIFFALLLNSTPANHIKYIQCIVNKKQTKEKKSIQTLYKKKYVAISVVSNYSSQSIFPRFIVVAHHDLFNS